MTNAAASLRNGARRRQEILGVLAHFGEGAGRFYLPAWLGSLVRQDYAAGSSNKSVHGTLRTGPKVKPVPSNARLPL